VLQTDREIERLLERRPQDLATYHPDAGFIAEYSGRRQGAIVLAEIERKLAKSPGEIAWRNRLDVYVFCV
jgi:hypothetical protein